VFEGGDYNIHRKKMMSFYSYYLEISHDMIINWVHPL